MEEENKIECSVCHEFFNTDNPYDNVCKSCKDIIYDKKALI